MQNSYVQWPPWLVELGTKINVSIICLYFSDFSKYPVDYENARDGLCKENFKNMTTDFISGKYITQLCVEIKDTLLYKYWYTTVNQG